MAKTVLTIAGYVVGAYFGYPQLGAVVGAALASAVPENVQGPRIGETPAQTSAEGAPRAIIYGTASCFGNVLCTGPVIKTEETESQGKGGSSVSSEVAYRNYAIRICEGPIGGILRVWEDDKLVYDVRAGSEALLPISLKWKQNKVFYAGNETQLPDVFLELNVSGVGTTPAYRGTAYMVVGLEDLTDRRGSIPQYRFEVAQSLDVEGNSIIVSRGGEGLLLSEDGTSFATDASDLNLYYLVRTGQRMVGWSINAGHPRYSDDGGSTWAPASGDDMGGAGGQRQGWADDDIVLVPVGTGILKSTDAGLSFSLVSGGPNSNAAVKVGNQWISLYSADLRYSTDDGSTWSTTYAINLTQSSGRNSVASDGDFAMACGSYLGAPRIALIQQGVPPLVSYETLPSLAGVTYIDVVACGTPGADQWVAVADDGTIIFKSAGVWTTVGALGVVPTGAYFNGSLFVIAGRTGVNGIIKTSPDGVTWTTAYSSSSEIGAWGAVVCLEPAFVGGSAVLSDIVSDIAKRCGLPLGMYDVSELTDEVAGLVLAGDYSGADAINTLRGPYFFDKTEYDKKIWFPKRGGAVVDTLDIDDLVEEPDTSKREQAIEFPKKLHLFYQHAASGYATVKATSSRSSPDARVVGETTVQVPVVLDENGSAQIANKMHKVAWAEAEGEVTLSVPESFIRFVPSNPIGLNLRGRVTRLRIDKIEYAAGVMNLTLRHDRQSAYTSTLTGVPITLPTAPPSTIVGDTTLAVMDIGARQDSEDDLHILVAGAGASEGWYRCALQRSLDAGANWTTMETFGSPSKIGSLLTAVPAASEHYTDTTNTVRVQLLRVAQTLEDLTNAQFLSEGGAFALENADGTFEVMQYRDATDETGGIFSLSYLHRGRLNSGGSAHSVGAKFVVLDTAAHIVMSSAQIGQSVKWRAVSLDQSPELALQQTATYVGRSQLEWPVASFALSRVSNSVTGTWAPRHRFGTDDAPVASANFTGYRVTIVGTSTVTFDQTSNTFTYDVSAIGGAVTVSVQALNRITGAGPAISGAI